MHMLNKYWIGWILIQLNQHLLSMCFWVSQPHHWYHFGPDDSLLWGHSVHCRMFRSFPGLYPLSANSTLQLWQPKMSFSSVQFSRSVVSDSLRPHESQHARPPCPSPAPGVHSDSRPSSQWCHPAISSSVVRFSSCPQSLPASGSFPMKNVFRYCQMYPEGRAEITLVENHWFTVFLTQSLSFFLF